MLEVRTIADEVRRAARDYPLRRVELFGSYAQGRPTDSSDVDLLVEFASAAVSLLLIADLKQRLEGDLGVSVDVVHAPIPEGSLIEPGKTVVLYEK